MNSKKEVQHVYLVGAKSLGAYGGYETFVYKLTEYHQNKENIKYHVACKANGDGCMDESKFDGVTRINEHEFELHNYLVVGRFVPENSFEVMIREFMKSKSQKDFAIITNVNDKFLNELEEKLHFKSDKRIKFVGTVYDQELLKKIRENAYDIAARNPQLSEFQNKRIQSVLKSNRMNVLKDGNAPKRLRAFAAISLFGNRIALKVVVARNRKWKA